MRWLFLIFTFQLTVCMAQDDKLFFKNGQIKKGIVSSVGNDFIFFRNSDTSSVQRIPKTDVLMIEKYDGKVLVFAKKNEVKDSVTVSARHYKNSFGLQPLNVFLGRITASYEFLNKNQTIGVMIPVSLTFDPVGVIYSSRNDSANTLLHTPGLNMIAGADINFYLGKNDLEGFYFGPRIRYGTDMFLDNIEAYSIQTQFGWRLAEPGDRLMQHVSVGVGFVRILASPGGNRINSKQSYGWGSINYRVAIGW